MKKCLLWGMGKICLNNIHSIKYYEEIHQFKIIGITSNTSIYAMWEGYPYINKEEIRSSNADIVIIMAEGNVFKEIYVEALAIGFSDERIIPIDVLKRPGFDIDKYINIKKNPPSLFANNCWAGLTYHSLGLKFTSPLINMFENISDYLKLLQNPITYMDEDLELFGTGYDSTLKKEYPIAKCNDILLHFNHYFSFDEAKEYWEKRKKRINWENIFVMMYTEHQEQAEEFIKLPYQKKICFVPYNTNENCLIYVDFRNKNEFSKLPFWKIINGMATGIYPYYNVFDLLENANFTKIDGFTINLSSITNNT